MGRKNSGWRRGRCGYLYHGSEDGGVGLIASTGFPSQKSISRAVIAVRGTRGRTVACAFSPFNFVCRPVAQFHSQAHTCIHVRLTVNRFVMNVGGKWVTIHTPRASTQKRTRVLNDVTATANKCHPLHGM